MRVETTELEDVLLFTPEPFRDERGLFTRTFDAHIFDHAVARRASSRRPVRAADFVQDSQSRSVRGVIRGMHCRSGEGEAKLVRCAHGAIYDVLVDVRRTSPTFGRTQAFTLDDDTFAHLFVPPGLLHGFQALTDCADVCYRIDREHDPAEDVAVAYDDPDLAIAWPLPVSSVSARDAAAASWASLMKSL
ncbi:dTDP-4-dehydrorhamnose 3,5-epimerase family protein [Rhodococcus opacus]|uniref:dTDP-4-dehydrorhamnose 3,5-epimerase family protein n=1 Tax=Rhodococcus opacus TaxID=37919 RepID=UPI000EA96826|nr:dTDP-4-dehydrorhamnose 3,5-epimerase family protein [Rhodococcus opacus]MDJ0414954.1 dTDP-4-dehydrorhamnose 3,5-epimerase family protein [Rhodococcus opacus]QZS54959.1 dTDP-4-dehydrorhamnose 3,5-epimerase family protein [Rhodococcus opacus]RKM71968.1 dTDP-4-dehydrorhamnose 3,5-epimerase [Rhodococcus opacus]WKN57924.1 dTDP-4-dehydrorhamnose 3,5-epimerase family protein [Rhodococcus opacus]